MTRHATDNELPVRILTKQEKAFVKKELLKVTSSISRWQHRINLVLRIQKPLSIADTKSLILGASLDRFPEVKKALEGQSLDSRFPSILKSRKKITSFSENYQTDFGASYQDTIIHSFAARCKSIAKNRARKISAELDLDFLSVYEDLLQDAYASVHHSMYYFTKQDVELSTFILGSVDRSIERCSRYKYCKLSPMSPEDTHDTYKVRSVLMNNPGISLEEIAEEISVSVDRASEILLTMNPVVRPFSGADKQNDSPADGLSLVPDKSSSLEESDNIDLVNFLKGIFDETDECILSLTKEEKDTLKAACFYNFERGWQSAFAKQYVNPATGKPYSRARVGQIFSSALLKLKSFVTRAA